MRDVTDILLSYREAKRHLWNTHFVDKLTSLRECHLLDRFEEIDRLLFFSIVLGPLQRDFEFDKINRQPIYFLEVIPLEESDTLPMMVSDPFDGANRSWNPETFYKIDAETKIAFISFFDWNEYGYVSFPYYRVKIVNLPISPDFGGREALVDTSRSRIVLT